MKISIRIALAGIFLLGPLQVAADWQIGEVTNDSPVAYNLFVGTTESQDWMNSYNKSNAIKQQLGVVEPGKKFKIPKGTVSYDNGLAEFPYLLIDRTQKVGNKSQRVRVFFPPNQAGAMSYKQDSIDKSKETLLLLSDTPTLVKGEQATLVIISPGKDMFIRLKQDDQGYQIFTNDQQKYRFGPQTGPRQGKKGQTVRGLSLANNVTDGDITIQNWFVPGEPEAPEKESLEGKSLPRIRKRINFEMWNKTPKVIYFELGTKAAPPTGQRLQKLAPDQSPALYTIKGIQVLRESRGFLNMDEKEIVSDIFTPNARGNAVLGVTMAEDGEISFYKIGAQHRQKRSAILSRSSAGTTPESTPVLTRRRAGTMKAPAKPRPSWGRKSPRPERRKPSGQRSLAPLRKSDGWVTPVLPPSPRTSREYESDAPKSPRIGQRSSRSDEGKSDPGSGK